MTEVKTFTGTIAQSLHVACVIPIGSPSWFKTEIFPVLRRNRKPTSICILNAEIQERGIKSVCRASSVCVYRAIVVNELSSVSILLVVLNSLNV